MPPAVLLATLDARSDALLGLVPGVPGMVQAIPTTAAAQLAAFGGPAGWAEANVLAIPNLTTASPLGDYLGLGPAFVAANAPLTGRQCAGLPYGAGFAGATGVEYQDLSAGVQDFATARVPFWSVLAGTARSALVYFRISPRDNTVAGRCVLSAQWGNQVIGTYINANLTLWVTTADGNFTLASVGGPWNDGAWHYVGLVIDDATKTGYLYTDKGDDGGAVVYTNVLDTDKIITIGGRGGWWNAPYGQICHAPFFDKALTSAMCTAAWRAFKAAALGTPVTYTRNAPLETPLGPSLLADFGVNQVGVGYRPALVSVPNGNPLGTGLLSAAAITFLGLGTTNQPAYVGTNATVAAADGPSAMQGAARVADADAGNVGFATSGVAALAGATAVPFAFAFWAKAVAGGGTNAVLAVLFTGDGGGDESYFVVQLAGTVPAAWGRFFGTITPVGNAHTGVVVRVLPTDGVAASTGTVDFYVEGGVQNRAVDWLGSRPVAAGAASATGAAAALMANAGNAYYNPNRGRESITVEGFEGGNGPVFLGFGAAGAAGALVLDHSGGLRLRIWDDAAVLVCVLSMPAVTAARHTYDVIWDAGLGYAAVLEGATVLASAWVGHWTPEAGAVTPLGFGCTSAGGSQANCVIERALLYSNGGADIGRPGDMILCLGDSNTWGYSIGIAVPFASMLPGLVGAPYGDLNAGVAGDLTAGMVARYNASYRRMFCKGMTLAGGVNDIASDVPLATIEANLEYLWTDVAARGGTPVATTVMPFGNNVFWSAGRQANLATLNAWIVARAAALGFDCVDLYTAVGDPAHPEDLDPAYDVGDGIHVNQAGHNVIAPLLAAVLP